MPLVVFLLCFFTPETSGSMPDNLKNAMAVMESRGPQAALEYARSINLSPYTLGMTMVEADAAQGLVWFSNLFEATKNSDHKYGIAWANYKLGDAFKARTALVELAAGEISTVQQARMHYLNGLLYFRARNIDSAISEFQTSRSIYKSMENMYKGEYNCLNMLSFSYLAKDDFQKVDDLLIQAEEMSKKAAHARQHPNLGTMKEVAANRQLRLGMSESEKAKNLKAGYKHFEKSIHLYQEALALFHAIGYAEKAQAVQVHIALIMAMTGNFEEGFALAEPLSSSNNPMIQAWAALFFMKLSDCGNDLGESRKWKNIATEWMVLYGKDSAENMLKMMLFLDRCGCLSPTEKRGL